MLTEYMRICREKIRMNNHTHSINLLQTLALVWEHLLQVRVQTHFPWIMASLQTHHNPWQNCHFIQEFAPCRSHSKTIEVNGHLYLELAFYFLPPQVLPRWHTPSQVLSSMFIVSFLTHHSPHTRTPSFLTLPGLIAQSKTDLHMIH